MEMPEQNSGEKYADGDAFRDNFPEEVLQHIFSFLDFKERIKTERVCKRWRYIGKHVPWKLTTLKIEQMDLSPNCDEAEKRLEKILQRCGMSMKNLDLSACSNLSSKTFALIGSYCFSLQSLKLSGIAITDDDLEFFSRRCSKLKAISLRGSSRYGIGNTELKALFENCQALEVLDLTSAHEIEGHFFHLIPQKLKCLKLKYCIKLLPEGLMKLGNCKCIEELQLYNCTLINNTAMEFLFVQTANTLKHLRIEGEFRLVDFKIMPFHLLTKLERLSVMQNRRINDNVLMTILQNCQNLRCLELAGAYVSRFGLNYLTECPQLKILNVSGLYVTDELIKTLALVGNLESITMHGNGYISDDGLSFVADHCLHLKNLDISCCERLTDMTVDNFRTAMALRRDSCNELTIIAGGTRITQFIEEGGLTVKNDNLCAGEYWSIGYS